MTYEYNVSIIIDSLSYYKRALIQHGISKSKKNLKLVSYPRILFSALETFVKGIDRLCLKFDIR